MVAALLRYRSFIWRHAVADLRHRYAGTGLGLAWNVVHPLAVIAIYSAVFGTVFAAPRSPGDGRLPYTMYLCAGFFPWLAFSDCVTRGTGAFVANAAYLKKLPIPEPVFVAQSAVAGAISLAINFALLLIVAAALGYRPGWAWALLPLPLAALQCLGFGVGLLLGTLNVFFRDVAEWTGIGLQLAFWTVPIVYRLDREPTWLATLLRYHPLMPALSAVRQLFLGRTCPTAPTWLAMWTWPLAAVAVAYAVLGKLRSEIRDVI
jgi:lipopolysaccharide transport system permease protein